MFGAGAAGVCGGSVGRREARKRRHFHHGSELGARELRMRACFF